MSHITTKCWLIACLFAACAPGPAPVTPRLPTNPTGATAVEEGGPARGNSATGSDVWAGTALIESPAFTAAPLMLPPVDRLVLPNGLTVILVRDASVPRVAMGLTIKAGRQDETEAQRGVSELTANLLVKGARGQSAQALARDVIALGSSLSADATLEATMVSCRALREHADQCGRWLLDMMVAPTFAPKELAAMQAQMRDSLVAERRDPGTLAQRHASNLLWGDAHPRGRITNENDVAARNRTQIAAWHRTHFAPNNAILAVSGDFDVAAMKAQLAKTFAGWKRRSVPTRSRATDPDSKSMIRVVDVPGARDAHVFVSGLGVAGTASQFVDVGIWTQVLGRPERTARLNVALPGGAEANLESTRERGVFRMVTNVPTNEALAAWNTLRKNYADLRREGPPPDELRAAQRFRAGAYAMRLGSADAVAAALVASALMGYDDDAVARYPERVAAVTAASATEAGRALPDETELVTVFVGDGDAVAAALSAQGLVFERVAGSALVGRAAAADPAKVAAAKAVLDAALAKKGGAAKLRALRSIVMAGAGEIRSPTQTVKVAVSRMVVLPDRQRVDIDLNGQAKITIAIAGRTGWQQSPDGVTDVPPEQVAALDADRWREPELLLLRHLDAGTTLTPLPDAVVDGKACHVIRLDGAAGSVTLTIDKLSKLLVRTAYDAEGTPTTDDLSDYRQVDGIWVAHRRRGSAGDRVNDYQLTKVEFNGAIDPAVFAKPKAP